MTTIDIKLDMSGEGNRPQELIYVRISKEDAGHRSDGEMNRIPNPSPSRVVKRGGKSPSTRRNAARQSFDVLESQMANLTQLSTYDARTFTITAYLPNQGMKGEKRLKLACCPGQTVQQVIETEIPTISRIPYQVYHFPSRALLNPEKEASVLQDQEIWIEPTTSPSLEESSDERLAVVKELLKTEDAYLEHLKNIFDVYMEPLRNWGVPQNDMNVLFRGLSRLCDLLMNFFSELELAVKSWNTKTSLIGGIFTQYASFWDTYIEYRQSYTIAKRLLKQKRLDESFSRFLEIKRGAAMHTLESLMLLPVQRVSDYQRYLSQLLGLTDPDHPDYQFIRMTVSRIDEIMRARADELEQLENESKLEQVQLQFQNDQLFLFEPLDAGETLTPKRSRGATVPGGPVPLRVPKMSVHCFPMDSTDGARKNPRMYIQEGPVKLLVTTKQGQLQTQDRYLFLFSDLLLIAKPANKSRAHQHRCYKMKNRLRLGEMWVANCPETFVVLPPSQMELAFVIGWPIGLNYVALFSSRAEKELWYNLISRNIEQQCSQLQLDTTQIKIYNQTKSNTTSAVNISSSFMIISVNALEKASAVLKRAVDLFKISEPQSEFQLAVKASRKDKDEVLHGHESPFAIQCQYNRQQLDQTGESRPQQLDFIIKRKPGPSPHPHRPSLIKIWRVKKQKQKRVFGIPLNEVIVNNQLPEILQEIIVRLWVEGPETFGIFRQSASYKRVRELKEMIDGREPVDLSEVSIHVIGALLKDFMRNVPGGILSSERYTEFVATNDINDLPTRIARLKGVIGKLHESNQLFLRYLLPLLHNISLHENVNQMTTTNLAICFAPSLLQPDSSLDVIKNEAPMLVDFLIKFAGELYSNELPELYKQPATARASSDDLASSIELIPVKSGPGKLSSIYNTRHRRNFSLDTNTSASEESVDETETESEVSPRKIPIHHTASDSRIDERTTGPTGMVRLLDPGKLDDGNSDMDEGDEDEEAVSPSYDSSNRWSRGGHGSFNKGRVRHRSGDSITSMGRRRSIATQNTNNLLPLRRQYSPDLEVILAPPMSPSSSHSGSSHGYSPKFSHPEGGSGRSGYRSDGGTRYKKRRLPRHSSSFSKPSDLQYNRAKLAMSTSSSFYDFLIPRDRGRSQSFGPGNIQKALGPEGSHVPSALPSSSMAPSARKVTNRSPNAKSSSQNQAGPTKVAMGGRRSTSPDPVSLLESGPMDQLNRDVVKQAISCRFGISTMDWPSNVSHHAQPSPGKGLSRPDKEPSRANGKRREGSITDYPYKLQSYHNGVLSSSTKPSSKSGGLLSSGGKIPEIQDYDERPEAEQHIHDYKQHSVGRGIFNAEPLHVGHMTEAGSRLTISSAGYNSDTESSPSRTLNRHRDKMQEVTSPGLPQSSRMLPSRYSTRAGFESESVKTQVPSVKTQPPTPPSSSVVSGKQDHRRQADASINTRFPYSTDLSQSNSRNKFSSSFEKTEPVSRSRASTVSHGAYRDRKTQESVLSPAEKEYKNLAGQTRGKFGHLEDVREDYHTFRGKEAERTRRSSTEKRQAVEELTKNISLVQTREMMRKKPDSPSLAPSSKFTQSEPLHATSKSRSMPDHHRRVVARMSASPQQIKTVQVFKYELPAPKKTRRINLRTCNK